MLLCSRNRTDFDDYPVQSVPAAVGDRRWTERSGRRRGDRSGRGRVTGRDGGGGADISWHRAIATPLWAAAGAGGGGGRAALCSVRATAPGSLRVARQGSRLAERRAPTTFCGRRRRRRAGSGCRLRQGCT